jgi:hypothetical protein
MAAMFAVEPPSSSDPTKRSCRSISSLSTRFVGSSCRSAARTSRARIARLIAPLAALARRGSRACSRCLTHSLAASCDCRRQTVSEAGCSLVRPGQRRARSGRPTAETLCQRGRVSRVLEDLFDQLGRPAQQLRVGDWAGRTRWAWHEHRADSVLDNAAGIEAVQPHHS